jgi:hypothetical protein
VKQTFNFIISKDGYPVFQGPSFNNFISQNKLKRGYMEVYLYDDRDNKQIAGYYHEYILSQLQIAYRQHEGLEYSKKEIEEVIWPLLVTTKDLEHKTIHKLTVQQINVLIVEIKRFAAENLKYYIA